MSTSGAVYIRVEADHAASYELRAGHTCVCDDCGRTYRDHPQDATEAHRADAVHVLCDGLRVKL